jgi:hypothetical protein
MRGSPVKKGPPVPEVVLHIPEIRPKPGFLSGVQYFYFLRFSLVLLISAPALALVDRFTGANSITRGIFTPTEWYDFVGEAFFLVCAGVIALVTSRLVVMNGEERYDVEPPHWLSEVLGSDSDHCAGWVLLAYQLPGLSVLLYLLHISSKENAPYSLLQAVLMSLAGIAVALIFWGSLNIIYYWTAEDGTGYPPRTILLPRGWLGLDRFDKAKKTSVLNPPAFVSRVWGKVAELGPGYSSESGQLYSGHQFAGIAAFGYFLVYAFLFPLTSPFTAGIGYRISLRVFIGATLGLAALVLWLKPPTIKWAKYLIAGELLILAIGAWCLLTHRVEASQTFPVLCSVLVLLSLLALMVCGIAFLLDRIHIPVVLATIVLVLACHMVTALLYLIPGLNHSARFRGFSDHYFEVLDLQHAPNLVTPAEVLKRRACEQGTAMLPCPIILVSATGGGIHAAAWTTQMLTELEEAFQKAPVLAQKGYTFHNNVALFSTVSGGSVGLLPFLNEYYADEPFAPQQWADRKERMFTASSCSSLEAVAWGLEYRDFDTLLTPWMSGLFSPKWDRSFALEAGFHRHLFDAPCKPLNRADRELPTAKLPLTKQEKTLGDFADGLRDWVDHHNERTVRYVPAFSMNTTAAETGGRFLFSDYHVVPNVTADAGVAPAEDFLTAFGARPRKKFLHPNIRLSTAARLSATFPYVSSAARSDQMTDDAGTLHFVDGGYYDNDGIATLVEFLLAGQSVLSSTPPSEEGSHNIPILLIEIRDGSDLDAKVSPEDQANEPHKPGEKPPFAWSASEQLAGPLVAFWSAGHEAVSRRNRRELEVLMNLLASNHVVFKHIVLDYKNKEDSDEGTTKAPKGSAKPLSWFLTPLQVARIRNAKARVAPCIARTAAWTASALSDSDAPSLQSDSTVERCALQ